MNIHRFSVASSVTDIGGSKPPPYRWDRIERQNRCIFDRLQRDVEDAVPYGGMG